MVPKMNGSSGVGGPFKVDGTIIALVILNTFKELYNIHPIVMLGLKKIAALEVNISILNLYEDMFYDALDEDGNRLIHLFAIHGRSQGSTNHCWVEWSERVVDPGFKSAITSANNSKSTAFEYKVVNWSYCTGLC